MTVRPQPRAYIRFMDFGQRLEAFRKTPAWLGAILIIFTILLYLPVIHYEFLSLWDDDAYVTDNPHVRTGVTPANLAWAFSSFEQSNWHPVTWISHMVDCQLFGMHAGAHHFVNLVLQAANVFLLFWLLQRGTGAVWRSFAVAAIFAAHPLNVETVAWIAQRKSLLSAFFSLLAVAAYARYVRQKKASAYFLTLVAFSLALLSKAMAVSLPLLLLLLDYWPFERLQDLPPARRWVKLILEKIPLFLLAAASSFLTEMAQGSGGSVMKLSMLPLSTRIENALIACVTYLAKIFWPAHLATYYPLSFSPPVGNAAASAAILLCITGLALNFRRARYFLVGWLFFLISLVPVIGIVQVGFQGMADRYTYIPSIGLLIAVVWSVAAFVPATRTAELVAASALLALVATFGVATVRYLECWRNNVALFGQARTAWGRPDFWLEQLYGNALYSAGQTEQALAHYQASCAIQPKTEYCHYNIAHILAGRGQFREAAVEYQLALRYTASRDMALLCLNELGESLAQVGDYAGAEQSIARALEIDPGNATALQLQRELMNRRGPN